VVDYRVGAARDLPLDTERAWDSGAARGRIWAWAGWDANTAPSATGGKTRQAFLVYDADAADTKGAYHLPFADVVDGRLTALASGLRASASRLPQMDGLPSAVRDRARGVLDAYFARIAAARAPAAAAPLHLGYRVVAPSFLRATDAATLEAIRRQSIIPESVDAASFLIVRSAISTGEPDSYKTVMDVTTLRNYAADAAAGVSVLYGHDTWAIVGRSYAGVYVARPAPGRCESEAFIPAGSSLGGIDTDAVIRAVSIGMLRDVSVGFTGGELRCSICERSIWDYECPHVPGVLYKVEGKRNPVEALAIVVDAHLAEYSLVYAGSTPSASVLEAKALREADAGRLAPADARALEVQHRDLRLGASHRAWAGFKEDRAVDPDDERDPTEDAPTEDDEPEADDDAGAPDPDDETTQPAATPPATDEGDEEEPVTKPTTTPPAPAGGTPPTPSVEERVRTLLTAVVEGEIGDVAQTVGAVTTELVALRQASAELATARERIAADAPFVGYGRAWLEAEVVRALGEGQRALGDKFDRVKWEPVLRAMEPDAVRLMADGWSQQGDLLFKPGRQTSDAPRAPSVAPPLSPAIAAGFRA
jgi:hypothetical protein